MEIVGIVGARFRANHTHTLRLLPQRFFPWSAIVERGQETHGCTRFCGKHGNEH
jgi:hypothetical protein